VTQIVCPFGCVCQAVRAPGVKWTLLALIRDPPSGAAIASMYTAPVNQSLGPRPVSLLFLVICMTSELHPGGAAINPFTLVQLSDPHAGADWGFGDPVAKLAAVVESVRDAVPSPDAVLISGDLAEHGAADEYERVRELAGRLGAPLHVLPGNHDDRAALRRHFGLPGTDAEPVQYAVELGPLRLVVLDSTRPGEDPGELDADRLGWLEATLAAAPEAPTLLALHHPPLLTGIPAHDRYGLPAADRQALGEVVRAHPQVRRIVAGHVHRTVYAELGGRSVLAAPSTYVQARLELGAEEIRFTDEPPGFVVHALLDGELVSHVQPIS
jgi:Icc protein